MNKWYVITGGPSTGKTTLLAELDNRGYITVPEAARTVIDNSMRGGMTLEELRADEKLFQETVLEYKVGLEKMLPRDQVTFFDRGMHDTLAYLRLKAIEIDMNIKNSIERARYKQVFLLDPLDEYVIDYARTETKAEALKLNDLIFDAFAEHGMKPIRVPASSPLERADFVLQRID